MAKLSARGRTELARVAREQHYTDRLTGEFKEYTVRLALMSDGKVLIKRSWRDENGKTANSGWTVRGTLKKGITTEQWVERRLADGWVKVSR